MSPYRRNARPDEEPASSTLSGAVHAVRCLAAAGMTSLCTLYALGGQDAEAFVCFWLAVVCWPRRWPR